MSPVRRIQRRAVTTAEFPTDLHPVLARLYAARAVQSTAELDYSLDRLLSPDRLTGMGPAVQLLAQALDAKQKILIVADFDFMQINLCS